MPPFEAVPRLASPARGDTVGQVAADGAIGVDANSPWLLDSAGAAWRVMQGRVDIFIVNASAPLALLGARREFVRSFGPDEVFGGRPLHPDCDVRTLAIGIPGTVLAAAPVREAAILAGPNLEPFQEWAQQLTTARAAKESTRI
ncbi:MAG: hypothetical protein WCP28_18930 [Actinomycetes bacterium]